MTDIEQHLSEAQTQLDDLFTSCTIQTADLEQQIRELHMELQQQQEGWAVEKVNGRAHVTLLERQLKEHSCMAEKAVLAVERQLELEQQGFQATQASVAVLQQQLKQGCASDGEVETSNRGCVELAAAVVEVGEFKKTLEEREAQLGTALEEREAHFKKTLEEREAQLGTASEVARSQQQLFSETTEQKAALEKLVSELKQELGELELQLQETQIEILSEKHQLDQSSANDKAEIIHLRKALEESRAQLETASEAISGLDQLAEQQQLMHSAAETRIAELQRDRCDGEPGQDAGSDNSAEIQGGIDMTVDVPAIGELQQQLEEQQKECAAANARIRELEEELGRAAHKLVEQHQINTGDTIRVVELEQLLGQQQKQLQTLNHPVNTKGQMKKLQHENSRLRCQVDELEDELRYFLPFCHYPHSSSHHMSLLM